MRKLIIFIMTLWLSISFQSAMADEAGYKLGSGDVLKISVHNNPDLSLDTRVPENGTISFPLIGEVPVGGITTSDAEKKIASMLKNGGYVKQPQVNILVVQFRSKIVSVLGGVNKPGMYSLERSTNLTDLLAEAGGASQSGSDIVTVISKSGTMQYDLGTILGKNGNAQNVPLIGGEIVNVHSNDVSVLGQVNRPGKYAISGGVRTLADFLSVAGGIAQTGSDTVSVTTTRGGAVQHLEIDIDKILRGVGDVANIELASGDTVYVARAPLVYIYGEVQRPGAFRIERDMTVIQALAQGGGLTVRGTQRGMRLHRRNADGVEAELTPALTDKVMPDDVLYVRESLF